MMSQTRSTHVRENSAQPHLVYTNDDLLTEILIQLPILCIHIFTAVSKQWLRILTSPYFTLRCRKIPNLDPPSDHSFGSAEEVDHVRILQSCNGLLLCAGSTWPIFYYVYNPSTNLFKRLSQPNYSHDDLGFYSTGVLGMVFDPRKSLYYKVVQAGHTSGWSIQSTVWSTGLGKREEDSLLVIDLSGKVVKHNLISKTINKIFHIGSNQMDDADDDLEFIPIPPYSVDPNLYELQVCD
nr:hypothetical protein [Tanacetum cinerariifolium]